MKLMSFPQILIITGLFSLPGFTQTYLDSTWAQFPIRSIQIHDNWKTKSAFIFHEMKTRSYDRLDPEKIEADRKRIQNLGLFNRVIILGEQQSDSVNLHIWVTEKYYIIPFPILHTNERSWKKISYGAGISHSNVRGMGQVLYILAKFGYNPVAQLGYETPWTGGKNNLTFQSHAYFQKVSSLHFVDKQATEQHWGISFGFGKRFNHYLHGSIQGGYKEVQSSKKYLVTLSETGLDRLLYLGASWIWDSRDLKEYPRKGCLSSLSFIKTGLPAWNADYCDSDIDLRIYFPLPKHAAWACRASSHLTFGNIPIHDYTYLGYTERIRGHFYTVTEGENRLIFCSAFHIPIIPITYMDLEEQNELQNLKFGLSLGFFVDTGCTYMQNQNPWKKNWLSGYGIGLHFHLPYVDILRLELAFNEKHQSQWIADLFVDI